jgi:hypothetical protein
MEWVERMRGLCEEMAEMGKGPVISSFCRSLLEKRGMVRLQVVENKSI